MTFKKGSVSLNKLYVGSQQIKRAYKGSTKVLEQIASLPATVAAYNFSEGSGTTAADSSGNGKTLTIAAGAATWGDGHTGGGLVGNGTGAVGGINTALFSNSAGGTIMGWVKPHTIMAAEMPLFGFWSSPAGDPNGSSQFALYATRTAFGTPGHLVGNLRIAGVLGEIVGPTLSSDTWVHVALTFDGTTIKLYVNGVMYTSVTRAGTINTSGNLGVAGRTDAAVDDIRISNTAWTVDQIAAAMSTPV